MELIAEKREIFGKKTKNIREERKVPAVVFGKGIESTSILIDLNTFKKVYREAGDTTLIDLKFDGFDEKVLVKEIQFHPVTSRVLHVSFHKVDLTQKITADIPVEIVGDEENELVSSGQAMVLTLLSEITVEAYPTDLPSEFVVDVSGLAEIGTGLTVAVLEYDKEKVSLVGYEDDELVVKLDYAEMEEEEEEVVSEEELIEGVEATEETAVEGEEGAESEGAGKGVSDVSGEKAVESES